MRRWFRGLLAGVCGLLLVASRTFIPQGQAGEIQQPPVGVVAIAFLDTSVAPGAEPEVTLLGGVRGRGWLTAQDALPHFRTGRTLTLFNPTGGSPGTVTLGRVYAGEFGEHSAKVARLVSRKVAEKPTVSGEFLAASEQACPHTRPINIISAQSPYYATYEGVVRDVLKAKGLTIYHPKIEKILRTDLNGDGEEEVLILANSQPKERTGSLTDFYSLAVLRCVKKSGAVVTLPLRVEANRKIEESGGYRVELTGLVDLNGDGKTEIVLKGMPYESVSYFAYTFDGKAIRPAFDFSWGP